jgi:hypothetical protein
VERSLWTDDRIDDLVDRLDTRFELLHSELREMRAEMRDAREETRAVRCDLLHGMIALFGVLAGMWATLLVQLVG